MNNKLLTIPLIILLIFLAMWFTVAHLLKRQFIYALDNIQNDNMRFKYKDVSIGGFPSKFIIRINEPLVTNINRNNTRDMAFGTIDAHIDLTFRVLKIITDNKIAVATSNMQGEQEETYDIYSEKPFAFIVKLAQPLFTIKPSFAELQKQMTYAQAEVDRIQFLVDGKEYSAINDPVFKISKCNAEAEENCSAFYQISGLYAVREKMLSTEKAVNKLSFDVETKVGILPGLDESGKRFQLSLQKFNFSLNDESAMEMCGDVNFTRGRSAEGEIHLSAQNYPVFIDVLLPSNVIRSKAFFKKVMRHAAEAEQRSAGASTEYNTIKDAKFSINFSDNGVTIGSVEMNKLILDNVEH